MPLVTPIVTGVGEIKLGINGMFPVSRGKNQQRILRI